MVLVPGSCEQACTAAGESNYTVRTTALTACRLPAQLTVMLSNYPMPPFRSPQAPCNRIGPQHSSRPPFTSYCRMNEEYRESLLKQDQKRLADQAAFQAKTTAAFQRAGGEALTQNLVQQQAADEARMRKLQVSSLCWP